MGKAERDKGHNFERKIARELRELGYDAKRGFQTRGGTAEEADVKGVGRLFIECKAHKQVNRQAAWLQAFDGARPGMIPIAVCKDDYKAPVAVLPLTAVSGMWDEGEYTPESCPLVEIRWDYFKTYLLDKLAKGEE